MATCPECRVRYEDDQETCPGHGALLPDELFVAADHDLEPETMVGEYRIDKKLGSGAYGDVYAGEQPLIGKRVAIKVLNRRVASDPGVVARFIAEARAVNRIQHDNIIDIFSFGILETDRGEKQHYFVMELLDGMTLGELLMKEAPLSVERALPILEGIADALDAAHEAEITHRDLKPDNVFLATKKGGRYFPKLLDFGVAKLAGPDASNQTATGLAIGTPRYMSPEQGRGKKVGPKSDIYALGVMVHCMLTGEAPFQGDSAMDVIFKHATEPPPAMSTVSELPPELDGPVLRMLSKRAKDRQPTARAAVDELAAAFARLGESGHETTGEAPTDKDEPAPISSDASELAPTRREVSGPTVRAEDLEPTQPDEDAPPAIERSSTEATLRSTPPTGDEALRSASARVLAAEEQSTLRAVNSPPATAANKSPWVWVALAAIVGLVAIALQRGGGDSSSDTDRTQASATAPSPSTTSSAERASATSTTAPSAPATPPPAASSSSSTASSAAKAPPRARPITGPKSKTHDEILTPDEFKP
jgi:serine/threonine protein kinase